MAYSGPPYNGQAYPQQQYAMNPGYAGIKPAANGLLVQNENAYPANGQIHPRYVGANHGYQPPIPAYNYGQPQPQPQQAFAVALPAPSLPQTVNPQNIMPKPKPPQAIPNPPPLDYQLLLLSMAEEYFAAAYARGSIADILRREIETKEYYKLIATGLGCLEALLKHFKLAPEREATVRLRYATILYEETENTMEVEEALSKGVSIADRHKFFDLKYNMQHLLARILFQNNARAAFKFLDGVIGDAAAYQHIAWVYAFRFLKVTLHLELSSRQDTTAALTQLRNLSSMADEYGDKAILAVATIMEALTCLKDSSNLESLEQAQRSLAKARSLQLDPAIGQLPQLALFTAFVDLCSTLLQFDPAQALQKNEIMQRLLEPISGNQSWTNDGSFAIPIPNARMTSCPSQSGIVRIEGDNSLVLMFNWLPKDDIYNAGYLLSGLATAHKNSMDGRKAEHMLEDGIRRESYAQKESSKVSQSLILATSQQLQREQLTAYMLLHLTFLLCSRSSWSSASDHLLHLNATISSWSTPPASLTSLITYLSGTIAQGTGNLPLALSTYRSLPLNPHPNDITLICTLNTLLILRTPNHPQQHLVPTLLAPLTAHATHHPNRQITSAYHLLLATLPTSHTILQTKSSLQSALQLGKATRNHQLQCLVLNIMSWKFFTGVVGEQAEKSARASKVLAGKWGDALWSVVGAGLVGECLEMAGRGGEAEQMMRDGVEGLRAVPEEVRRALGV